MNNKIQLYEEFKQKKKTKLVVTFDNLDESDLKELQRMFSAMNWSGSVGASRQMKVYVDGDGAFRSKITMNPEPSEEVAKGGIEDFDNDKLSIGLGC